MTKEEAVKALAEKVAEFEKALREAEEIADAHNLTFYIEPAYGMGGAYEGGEEGQGWNTSSKNC